MFARLRRIFRSFFGLFISLAEDPKLILQQNIRDMNDKIPEMNTGIAKARGGLILLENEEAQYKRECASLTAKIKTSLLAGEEGLAGQFAVQLKSKQDALARNQAQLASTKQGYDGLLKLKERFMREMKTKTEQAMTAIKEADAAKWKGELADVFQSFEVAGVDQTHGEMIDKLKEKTAMAEGKIAAAVEGIDMKTIEIEQKAEALEGQELLAQFKLDLGLTKPAVAPKEEAVALEDFKKTIGDRVTA